MALDLQKLLRPLHYLYHHFDDIPQDLLGDTNAVLVHRLAEINCALRDLRLFHLLEKNELFQEHIARLKADDEESALPEISHSLDKIARRLAIYTDRGQSRHNSVVCTVALGDAYRRIVAPCLESHRRYAGRAGADHVQLEASPTHQTRAPAWNKIPLIYRLLRGLRARPFPRCRRPSDE